MNNRNTQSDSDQKDSFCSTCGEQIIYDLQYCPKCGSKLFIRDLKNTQELKQGHSFTKIILSSSFVLLLVTSVLNFLIAKNQNSNIVIVLLVLLIVLYSLLFQGYRLARYITIAIFGFAGIYGITIGTLVLSKSFLALIPIALGIVYVFFSIVLLKSKSIRLFLEYQRERRKKSNSNTTIWMIII